MQPINRDYHTNHEALQRIREEAAKEIAIQDEKVRKQLQQINTQISPKILQKRLRRIDGLCKKTLEVVPAFKHFENYTVKLTTDEDSTQVIEIKFNGSTKPGHIRSVTRHIPLYDIQNVIKRMAEKVRRAESFMED